MLLSLKLIHFRLGQVRLLSIACVVTVQNSLSVVP